MKTFLHLKFVISGLSDVRCFIESIFLWRKRLWLSHVLVGYMGGMVALCLVHLSPDRAVQVQALAGDIAFCS